jgi:hypothetical protein
MTLLTGDGLCGSANAQTSELVFLPNLRCRDGEVNLFEPTFVDVACHNGTGVPHRRIATENHYDSFITYYTYFHKTQV